METIKAIPIHAYPESAWQIVLGMDRGAGTDALALYRRVGVVHRCCKVRAKSVKAMPLALYRGSRDISETPDGIAELQKVRHLLYMAELSICLYGAAYALKQQTRLTKTPFLRWITSSRVKPKIDKVNGLTGFKRSLGETEQMLRVEDVWHVWLQDPSTDIGPDVAPAAVALRAAGVLDNLDLFLEQFFDGGAIRATLLKVKGNPTKAEKEKLEAWWKKTLSGVKNAFRASAVSVDVEPMVIGDSLADTLNVDLSEQKTMDVLTAMEVPASLVLANAANYATARQDALNFYMQTIIPDVEMFQDTLNDQWYRGHGLELVTLPEQIEVFQQAELEKAQSLNQLTGQTILTLTEARQRMELEPIEQDAEEAERLRLSAALALMQAAVDVGYSVAQAAELAGLPAPDEPEESPAPMIIEQPLMEPSVPQQLEMVDDEEADLRRWRRKAQRAGKAVSFESRWIDPYEAALINERLAHATSQDAIAAAFKQVDPGTDLSPFETMIFEALRRVFTTYERSVLDTIIAGGTIDLATLPADLRAVLVPALTQAALSASIAFADEIGPEFDDALVQSAASDWAAQYAGSLEEGLTATTQQVVQRAVSTYLQTPGMTRGQLQLLLKGAFGARRAETIAITEITRAAAQGARIYQQELSSAGLTFDRIWQTNDDAGVCPVCSPLDGKAEAAWSGDHPDGPPAHARCRCFVTLRRRRNEP